MKKYLLTLVAVLMTITASAQFEEGKMYGSASVTGLGLNYSGEKGLNLGVGAKAGYCFMDNWMVLAGVGLNTQTEDAKRNTDLEVGVGARYYIIQNGIYLGVNAKYKHYYNMDSKFHNDVLPGIEVGYAFFINHYCTIEPAVYYDQSFNNHGKYSTFGLKIGFGIYM